MSDTKVVHCHKEKYDIYIGRRRNNHHHYGNPFSHLESSLADIRVVTREESIVAFRCWLAGTHYQDVEPSRRAWILANIQRLKGKTLGCFCRPEEECHGDVLKELCDACD